MRTSLLAAAAAAVLTLSACGSDSDSGSASVDTTAAASADTTAAAGAGDTTAAADSEFSGDDSETFCALAKQFDENDPTADLFTSDDPEQLKADWATAQGLVNSLTEEAPAEIKPDFEVLSAGFEQVGNLYDKYDWDLTKLAEAAETDPDVAALEDSAEADAASGRVDAYLQQVCGIDTEG